MTGQPQNERVNKLTNGIQTVVIVLTFVASGFAFWLSVHDNQVRALEKQEQLNRSQDALGKSLVETNSAISKLSDVIATMGKSDAATQQVLIQLQREIDQLRSQQVDDRKHCDELFAKNLEAFTALLQQLRK